MSWKGHCKNALFALALASLIAPQAEAIEIFMGANPAAHVNDDLFTQVRGGRGGGGMRNASPRRGRHASRRRHARRDAQARRRIWRDAQARWRIWRCPRAGRSVWRRAQAGRSICRQRQSQHQQERQSQRQPQYQSGGLRRRSLWQLGPARLVRLATWRRHRGRRGDRLRQRGDRSRVGRTGARARPVLVLHRPQPAAGVLGRLPVGLSRSFGPVP